MFGFLSDYFFYGGGGIVSLVFFAFNVWMFVDAIRRGEVLWAVFIFVFPFLNGILYYFFVYRPSGGFSMQGFELPGAHDRRRIKWLQDQIHHLDKAHHHSQLADIYFSQGKLEKAEASYRAAMERDAEDIDTRAHFGQCLLRRKRPKEALELLEGVCSQDPKHDYGHSLMALAETYMELGEMDKALATWEVVLHSHGYARARVQLASIYIARKQGDKARPILEEVVGDDLHAPRFQRKRDRVWVRRARRMLKEC